MLEQQQQQQKKKKKKREREREGGRGGSWLQYLISKYLKKFLLEMGFHLVHVASLGNNSWKFLGSRNPLEMRKPFNN